MITVCADGHVSVMERSQPKQRRLGAALQLLAVDDILDAMELIRRLCCYSRCAHGGRIGTLIEPRVISWPMGSEGGNITNLEIAKAQFEEEYKNLLKETGR